MIKVPNDLIKIFTKCKVCGFYSGTIKEKDLDWTGSGYEESSSNSEEMMQIYCLCESPVVCSKCKKNKIWRSMSPYYYEVDNSIRFRPCFASRVPCKECRTKGGTIADTCPAQA